MSVSEEPSGKNFTRGQCKLETQTGDEPAARFGHTTTYVGNQKMVLFGGATGDAGHYDITADTYIFDICTFKWSRVTAENPPNPRAAHAATAFSLLQLVVFGGAEGGGSLCSDELYLLDLRKNNLSWVTITTKGEGPGRRYGHTMVCIGSYLILFGGNDGSKAVNDVWIMDLTKNVFQWIRLLTSSELQGPCARAYHSADVCRTGPASGMMVVFGGRSTNNKSLNDAWGLRQHRNGEWDWLEAPTKESAPEARYQHTCAFAGSKLLVVGGRSDSDCTKPLNTAIYDTETTEWRHTIPIKRFRHASWVMHLTLFVSGGFGHSTQQHPLNELLSLDLAEMDLFSNYRQLKRLQKSAGHVMTNPDCMGAVPNSAGLLTGIKLLRAKQKKPTETRLSCHAHAGCDKPVKGSIPVRKISIDKLEEEGRKINKLVCPVSFGKGSSQSLNAYRIILQLLKPNISMESFLEQFEPDSIFSIPKEDIISLCTMVTDIFQAEDTILPLRAPINVYGDIHGQYYDLMRFFGTYKSPVDEEISEILELEGNSVGNIDSIDYLFLGDYVDRGSCSLEVICLLFALKCQYPQQLHLIRGNHEDPAINSLYGFQDECRIRLGEDTLQPHSSWSYFNRAFEMMPLGAVIENSILCIHGGLGGSILKLTDIEHLSRPLRVALVPTTDEEQKVTDLLWSDPTDNDSILGVLPNEIRDPDGSGRILKFGPDRVVEFLEKNELSLIIRAHECVMDGFERFAGGKLITLFSATNYCNHHQNAGALLFIKRDMTIVPKLIFPTDAPQSYFNTWNQMMTELRPPTPPRNFS